MFAFVDTDVHSVLCSVLCKCFAAW